MKNETTETRGSTVGGISYDLQIGEDLSTYDTNRWRPQKKILLHKS